MSNPRRCLCVDAGVGVKWLLGDEEERAAALSLLDRYLAGEVDLVVPDVFFVEVSNALLMAVRRKRLSGEEALQARQELMDLHLESSGTGFLLESALLLGLRLGLTAYDAVYLALAESQGIPLVTADKKLLASGLDWVIHLNTLV